MARGLNLAALKNVQKKLEERGSGNTVHAGKLGEEFDFRVLPPIFPEQEGIYFLERKVWWIDNKPYTSPATFGEDDVIEEEIEEARELATKDRTLSRLLDDEKKLKQQTEYWVPALLVNPVGEFLKGAPEDVEVVDGKAKIISMGSMLLKAINQVAVGRNFQNGTLYGFTDRVEGFNILGTKTGSGLNTEYGATGWSVPWEMDEKYYTEKEIPNVVEITKKQIRSDEYLRSVIRNYLYGEAIIEDKGREESDKKDREEKEDKPVTRGSSSRGGSGRGRTSEETDEKPARATRGRTTKSKDEEGDEKPVGRKTSAATGRSIVDDVAQGLDGLSDD